MLEEIILNIVLLCLNKNVYIPNARILIIRA